MTGASSYDNDGAYRQPSYAMLTFANSARARTLRRASSRSATSTIGSSTEMSETVAGIAKDSAGDGVVADDEGVAIVWRVDAGDVAYGVDEDAVVGGASDRWGERGALGEAGMGRVGLSGCGCDAGLSRSG